MSKEIAAKLGKASKDNVSETLAQATAEEIAFWEKVYVSTLTPNYLADSTAAKVADKTAREHADRALKSRKKTFK